MPKEKFNPLSITHEYVEQIRMEKIVVSTVCNKYYVSEVHEIIGFFVCGHCTPGALPEDN